VLEQVRGIDAMLIATPVYFGSETAAVRALIEQLCFPYLNYADFSDDCQNARQLGVHVTTGKPF